jgi:hypothetical protein
VGRMKYLIPLMLLLFVANELTALEKDTHYSLNGTIVNQSVLDRYLQSNLGFSKGIKEVIKGKRVEVWFQEGGPSEDEPLVLRARNHFHNPLKPWDQSGLTDFGSLDSIGFTPMSSILWAQDQSDRRWIDFGGDWSWKKARSYFYTALTGLDSGGNVIAADKTQRDAYFAKTFQAVGQIMHLVQDASVPAHVRNDGHIS